MIKYEKSVIVYYGASGHRKGLVDAMSGFGVKGPLRKAVLTQDFFTILQRKSMHICVRSSKMMKMMIQNITVLFTKKNSQRYAHPNNHL